MEARPTRDQFVYPREIDFWAGRVPSVETFQVIWR